MKTKHLLFASLAIMAGLIAFALLFRDRFLALLNQPALAVHARFVHIAAATVFFANAAIGMLWERRSLLSGRKEVILQTYETVAWLDARLSSPLIILSLVAGLVLGVTGGGLFETGWLSWSFFLFLFSGIFWVLSDIPTQYKVKRLMAGIDPEDPALPAELIRLLRLRWWISLAGVAPLVVVFLFMVYKPALVPLAALFR
ncbi:MAG TPA: DUF2269 family protein [Deltaproteobacteria bacterium]|nr:DUF2269 family protein [Deltaproteobacteria bacterium]